MCCVKQLTSASSVVFYLPKNETINPVNACSCFPPSHNQTLLAHPPSTTCHPGSAVLFRSLLRCLSQAICPTQGINVPLSVCLCAALCVCGCVFVCFLNSTLLTYSVSLFSPIYLLLLPRFLYLAVASPLFQVQENLNPAFPLEFAQPHSVRICLAEINICQLLLALPFLFVWGNRSCCSFRPFVMSVSPPQYWNLYDKPRLLWSIQSTMTCCFTFTNRYLLRIMNPAV